jgi:hypothetical protein
MATGNTRWRIENCAFLLDFQKNKVIEMLGEDGIESKEDYREFAYFLITRLFNTSWYELTVAENTVVEYAAGDWTTKNRDDSNE